MEWFGCLYGVDGVTMVGGGGMERGGVSESGGGEN